jgi:hypothetical protein
MSNFLLKTCVVFCLFISNMFANASKKEYVVWSCPEHGGLFHVFICVLDLLKTYETGYFKGLEINFGTKGVYYDANRGPNWWTYYFEPINYGTKSNVHRTTGYTYAKTKRIIHYTSRGNVFNLINKHIKLKPHIQEKINNFSTKCFSSHYVIGVHYRGTDKIKEAPPVPYSQVAQEIQNHIGTINTSNYKIFVATDEQNFIVYLESIFGEKVCYYEDAIRSTDGTPIHLDPKYDHYKSGEDAIIDALLLSKTNFLIRMNSNLSLCSTYFNPHLKSIELNQKYQKVHSIEIPKK